MTSFCFAGSAPTPGLPDSLALPPRRASGASYTARFGSCAVVLLLALAPACSARHTTAPDGDADGAVQDGSVSGDIALRAFAPPVDPGPGGVLFAASGELAALTGFRFPPNPADSPAFVDGWEVHFTRLLATVDHLRLASNPDVNPGNQALTGPPPGKVGGGIVAQVDGPWAVDLASLAHDGPQGPEEIEGKGDPGVKAIPLAALSAQNRNSNRAFATDGTRYAFSFDVVAARPDAYSVNLDDNAQADYALMVTEHCSVLYVGTATFKGGTVPGFETCNAGHETGWPAPNTPVTFRLCFASPTSYLNCQNPDLTGLPLGSDESPRGIPLSASQSTLAQITLHSDHPFWDSVLHDSPAHFDAYAGRLVGRAASDSPADSLTVTLNDLVGVDFGAVRDGAGHLLTWRTCMAPPTDVHAKFVGPMSFDRQSVPRAVGNDPSTGLRDLADYVTYNQSTQGHLNADGLCAIQRNYPSPP